MAGEFRRVAHQYGPQAVGVISTGQLVTEEFYTLGKLVQLGLGTPRTSTATRRSACRPPCRATSAPLAAMGRRARMRIMTKADVVLLIGANIAENHPILCQHLDANRAKTLIVADPRVTKTAMMADIYLPVKPRSDLALLNGIAHILIRDGLIDREYIQRHTNGFDELCGFLEKYEPECCQPHHWPQPRADPSESRISTETRRRRLLAGRWASITVRRARRP